MKLTHKKAMQLIHVAKRNLALEEDEYRDIIRSVGGAKSGSAKDLNDSGVNKVLNYFRSLGWVPSKLAGNNLSKLSKYRPGMATQKQIRMLLAVWVDAARTPTEPAFNHFLNNRFEISHYRFLPQRKVQGVKTALESMRDRKIKEEKTNMGNVSHEH